MNGYDDLLETLLMPTAQHRPMEGFNSFNGPTSVNPMELGGMAMNQQGQKMKGQVVDEFGKKDVLGGLVGSMLQDDPDERRKGLLKLGITAATGGAAAPYMGMF